VWINIVNACLWMLLLILIKQPLVGYPQQM
jgi:hypothetical protein